MKLRALKFKKRKRKRKHRLSDKIFYVLKNALGNNRLKIKNSSSFFSDKVHETQGSSNAIIPANGLLCFSLSESKKSIQHFLSSFY